VERMQKLERGEVEFVKKSQRVDRVSREIGDCGYWRYW